VALHSIPDPPHWHLVTYGLSELNGRGPAAHGKSGLGFELTLRIGGEEGQPLWGVDFLATMATYVRSSGHPFSDGHLMDLRGPMRLDSPSEITAAVIVDDPALPILAGPFGEVQFLQFVGLTADELELCRAWSADGVVDLLGRDDPLLITRLDRPSVAADPRWAEEIAERRRLEGSSLHELRIATLDIQRRRRRTVVRMGAGAARALGPALRRELVALDASFSVVGDESDVRFVVADRVGWTSDDEGVDVTVPLDRVDEVASFFEGRDAAEDLEDWPGLQFHIVP
jgi:hypothetical protein